MIRIRYSPKNTRFRIVPKKLSTLLGTKFCIFEYSWLRFRIYIKVKCKVRI